MRAIGTAHSECAGERSAGGTGLGVGGAALPCGTALVTGGFTVLLGAAVDLGGALFAKSVHGKGRAKKSPTQLLSRALHWLTSPAIGGVRCCVYLLTTRTISKHLLE